MGHSSEATMNRKFIETMKLLNIYLNHFPKHEKYALAASIRNTAHEVYDYITEANKRYIKKTTLVNLDIAHQKLRMKIYLAHELGYFAYKDTRQNANINPEHRFMAINRLVDELGRMIGAWISHDKAPHVQG